MTAAGLDDSEVARLAELRVHPVCIAATKGCLGATAGGNPLRSVLAARIVPPGLGALHRGAAAMLNAAIQLLAGRHRMPPARSGSIASFEDRGAAIRFRFGRLLGVSDPQINPGMAPIELAERFEDAHPAAVAHGGVVLKLPDIAIATASSEGAAGNRLVTCRSAPASWSLQVGRCAAREQCTGVRNASQTRKRSTRSRARLVRMALASARTWLTPQDAAPSAARMAARGNRTGAALDTRPCRTVPGEPAKYDH